MDASRGECAVLKAEVPCIRVIAETGSTNSDMLALAAAGAEEGCWLRAERQTAGRGRLGRNWVSPPGNLHSSTLVRLRADDPPAATLALVAAIAIYETANSFLGGQHAGLRLKWPNDLMLDGAKLSGTLLERSGPVVVIGIGVNVAMAPDITGRATTSLASYGVDTTAASFLDALSGAFAHWLAHWRDGGLAKVRARWLEYTYPVATALTVKLPDGGTLQGFFDGLDSHGALLLRQTSGERRVVHAGDISLT